MKGDGYDKPSDAVRGERRSCANLAAASMSRPRILLPVPDRARLATEVDCHRHAAQDSGPSLHQSTARVSRQPAARKAAQHFKALGGM